MVIGVLSAKDEEKMRAREAKQAQTESLLIAMEELEAEEQDRPARKLVYRLNEPVFI